MKTASSRRLKVAVRGAVQGVGFRPFVHRLATEHRLTGWVCNSPQGVFIEAEGPAPELKTFLARLETEKPSVSSIQNLEFSWLDAKGYSNFEIRKSETSGNRSALVLPDLATCPECLHEIFDPANRRYLYPFTNCTHCGPRFSIIESLPYDRANTSMKRFAMCPDCQSEYDDPLNRRFHAQPNACPNCGPHLEIWQSRPSISAAPAAIAKRHPALSVAAKAIRRGQIVAVKGIGGFHLMVDAGNDDAVKRLRARKHREEKPFALLFPSVERVRAVCEISALEERILLSREAPIVLLKKNASGRSRIAGTVAPENPHLGVMLPSNPLHHILMAELGFPVVATSGNLTDEPICTDELDAAECLAPIADLFLVHNRPIVRHVDDSIVRTALGQEMILRRARGYTPLPINCAGLAGQSARRPETIMAVGGHLKNSVALAVGEQVFISQHIGDLETEKASAALRRVITDFQRLYDARPQTVAADFHPDYLSTKFAFTMDARPFRVQHHVAHVLSCMADNAIEGPVLGVSWDGTGYGPDGTIWGGEFFVFNGRTAERVAHLRPFPLPGGEAAVRQPRRAALGLVVAMTPANKAPLANVAARLELSLGELRAFLAMLQKRVCSPMTSSVGRLFDAVSALTGLCQTNRFEGQAAMALEFALDATITEAYPMAITDHSPALCLDWQPMVEAILSDISHHMPVGQISAKFHNTLVEGIIEIAKRIGLPRVVLSGGCFQNQYLLERTVARLRKEEFVPFWHRSVPPNDGGIALGQIVAARQNITLIAPQAAPKPTV
ncbi:MAG TPA: carbamoyltransferase HypF, partial [Alphaproteobacteria bacterium]|nr:carbamoyltransferase HypF [Alphaproteobacteria bacterium]